MKRDEPLTLSLKAFGISRQVDSQTEPGLKGFIFEAQKRAAEDPEYRHLFHALASMGTDRLELEKRRKSGKGIWYAVVEVIVTRPEGYTETVRAIHERCDGRNAAVTAVRRLLVEHVNLFAADRTLEPSVMTDLEWETRALPD